MRNVDYKRARHFEVDLSDFRNILEIDKEGEFILKRAKTINLDGTNFYLHTHSRE